MDTSSGYAGGPGGDNGRFSNFATKDNASRAVNDPGADIHDSGGGTTNDCGSFSNFTTSASTLSKASMLYVSSSITTRVSLLSLSDKSTADVVECADVLKDSLSLSNTPIPKQGWSSRSIKELEYFSFFSQMGLV